MPEVYVSSAGSRTLSIRIEVEISDVADLAAVREHLVDRARRAVEGSMNVERVWFASSVLRRK